MSNDFSDNQQIMDEGNFKTFDENNDSQDYKGNGAGDPNASVDIDDDGTDDSRKIFVGGLSWETSEKDLKEYFGGFGSVKTCTIKVDKYTGHSRGFGFVIFDEEETVTKVLANKDHRLNNKQIDPKPAKPNREPLKKIFVGGLDPDVTEEQIREYFSKFGKIDALDLPFDNQKSKRKAYIFVTFAAEGEAKKASKQEKQDIFGKQCDVRIALPREQAQRQRAQMWNRGWGMSPYGGYGGGGGNYGGYDYYGGCSPYDYAGYSTGGGGYYGNYGGYDYAGYGGGGYTGFGRGKIRGGGRGGSGFQAGGGGSSGPQVQAVSSSAAPNAQPSNAQGYHLPYNRQ